MPTLLYGRLVIDPGLRDKIVLVTGANSPIGIGAATARAFATQGAAVFLHYVRAGSADDLGDKGDETARDQYGDPLSDEPSGEDRYLALQHQTPDRLVDEIRAAGGRAAAWEVDLADPAAASELFDRAEAALGPVDILVNNAAYCQQDTLLPPEILGEHGRAVDGFPMAPLTADGLDRHLAVNARAPALLMAELARRHLADRPGSGRFGARIVNVSTDGARGFPTEVSYGASKYALESLSRAAAHELGPHGINVNVVSLGPIQTGWISPELEASIASRTPLRRVGLPEDVADVIVFLASHQARWITGQVIHVGGGHTI